MIVYDTLPGRLELNEAARPKAPAIPHATDRHRRVGARLGLIHDAHRRELRALRATLDRIAREGADAGDLAVAVGELGMARNLELFGALCGRECSHLQFHHDIEEGHTFPIMERRGSDGLRLVIAKLREEHEVVHALIAALHDRTVRFTEEPSETALEAVREALDRIEEVVHSHFGYEEAELEEALGVHDAL